MSGSKKSDKLDSNGALFGAFGPPSPAWGLMGVLARDPRCVRSCKRKGRSEVREPLFTQVCTVACKSKRSTRCGAGGLRSFGGPKSGGCPLAQIKESLRPVSKEGKAEEDGRGGAFSLINRPNEPRSAFVSHVRPQPCRSIIEGTHCRAFHLVFKRIPTYREGRLAEVNSLGILAV